MLKIILNPSKVNCIITQVKLLNNLHWMKLIIGILPCINKMISCQGNTIIPGCFDGLVHGGHCVSFFRNTLTPLTVIAPSDDTWYQKKIMILSYESK